MLTRKRARDAAASAKSSSPKRQGAEEAPQRNELVLPPGYHEVVTKSCDGHVYSVRAEKDNHPGEFVNIFRLYYGNGKLCSEAAWDAKASAGRCSHWFEDDVLNYEYHFLNLAGEYVKFGVCKTYDRSGQQTSVCHYNKKGEKHGTELCYAGGKLYEQTTYVDGQRHGSHRLWGYDGELIRQETYNCESLLGPQHTRNSDGTYFVQDLIGTSVVGIAGEKSSYMIRTFDNTFGNFTSKTNQMLCSTKE